MLKAFLTGGLICVLGQLILNTASSIGADKETAGNWCSLLLIFISVILTGLNVYSKIGKFGGAGGLVPITGFANSVAASAIEYRAEGQVFGIGCKISRLPAPSSCMALSSWLLGLIYYVYKLLEVICEFRNSAREGKYLFFPPRLYSKLRVRSWSQRRGWSFKKLF